MLLTCASLGGSGSALGVSVAGPITGFRVGPGLTTSDAASVTISNGVGPYTYSWEYESGDSFTITTPSGSTTTFRKTLAPPIVESGTYRVTVTDTGSGSATATTTFTVTLEATESGGG